MVSVLRFIVMDLKVIMDFCIFFSCAHVFNDFVYIVKLKCIIEMNFEIENKFVSESINNMNFDMNNIYKVRGFY